MRLFFPAIILIMAFFLSIPVHAEFYRFKDQNGVTIFTDDLSLVPEDQRPGIKVYESTISQPDKKKVEKSAIVADSKANVLEKQKEWLIHEQNMLNRESDELNLLKNTVITPEEQEIYNNKVQLLNKRIDTYKEKLARFTGVAD